MTREMMLKRLTELPHAVTEDLVVFDSGCQFSILTSQAGFSCLVGGSFPLHGPFKLSRTQHDNLMRIKGLKGDDSLHEAIEKYIQNEKRRAGLLHLLDKIRSDVVEEILRINWPAERSFHVFNDMGSATVAIFPNLESAYTHFIDYFTEEGGVSWASMDESELTEWYEIYKRWRHNGSRKLPPKSWLGAYYSPWG